MTFTTFFTAVLLIYGGYYLIVIISELFTKKGSNQIDNSKLDFVFSIPENHPQKIGAASLAEENKEKMQETGISEEQNDWRVEKVGEDLQGDLGLETITEGTGIEVSEENLQSIIEQNK